MNLFSQLTGMYGVKIMDPIKISGITTISPREEVYVLHNAFGLFNISKAEFDRMCADPGYRKLDAFNVAHDGKTVQDPKYEQYTNALPSTPIAPSYPNPVVIYHANCADGFSAAWVFYHVQNKIRQEFDFHAGVYGEEPPNVAECDVYLVDFSYPRQVVKDMLTIGGARSVTVIDHHKTAMENLTGLDEELEEEEKIARAELDGGVVENGYGGLELIFDMEMSGATMAWQYWVDQGVLYPEHRPVLLGHVEDRDLWRFKLPLTREIQANVFSYEYTFENWDRLMASEGKELFVLAEGGMAIERKHHKDIAELVKVCQRWMKFASPYNGGEYLNVPVASLPYTLTSDAGHLMAKSFNNGKSFAACYWDTADHRIFSLRSVEGIGMDVSHVAELYGGGGHKHAAGFKVSRDHPLAMA